MDIQFDFYFPTYNLSYFVNNYSQPPDLSIALTVLQYGGKTINFNNYSNYTHNGYNNFLSDREV